MSTKKRWLIILLLAACASFAMPVFAGGWASVTVDSLPETIQAGETARIEFTILQHGKTPVHTLNYAGKPTLLTPTLTATLDETTLTFEAQPAKQVGHWYVDVTLPQAGAWQWSITPAPLAGGTQLAPLQVESAAAPAMGVGAVVNSAPWLLGLMLVGLAVAAFVWWRGRKTAVLT